MKKTTSTSLPKTTKRTKKNTSDHNLMAKKLDSVLETSSLPEPSMNNYSSESVTRKKQSFPWWSLLAILLILIFAALLLYEYHSDFKKSINNLLGFHGPTTQPIDQQSDAKTAQPIFEIPLTIVYNSKNAEQKQILDNYLQNLETNLENTKTNVTWLDKDDPQAKAYLEKTERKYLPLFITTEKIKEHPRFADFSAAVQEKNGLIFLQSEGMEYLEIPAVGDAHYGGNSDPQKAKVVIIEYASLTCHYCQEMSPILAEIAKTTSAPLSIVYKHFDRGGPDSILAQAVECAGDQKLFEPLQSLMYANQTDLFTALQKDSDQNKVVMDFIEKSAQTVAKDFSKFNIATLKQCVNSKKYEVKIASDTKEAESFGIGGTPAFFINKQFVGGAIPAEKMKAIIDSELAAQP